MQSLPHEQRLRQLSCWRGLRSVEILNGGVSNVSFKVTDTTGSYVVRLGADYPFHQVFRDVELATSQAAHAAGLSPEVVHSEPGVMVVRFIDAKTYGEVDVRANIESCVEIIRRCHHEMARRVCGRISFFWVFQVIRNYLHILKEADHADAHKAGEWSAISDRMEAAQDPLPIVFGHHDLLPSNFLHDRSRLWLIDWEYGGFGTAMFDLANLSANNQFSQSDDMRLLELYFDRQVPESLIRSFHAMRCASALREALWGMASEINIAGTGIDYVSYAAEYLGRLQIALDDFNVRYGQK